MTQERLAACALLALGCSLLVVHPHHANSVHEHEHENRATDRPAPPVALAATTTRLHLKLGPTGHPEIPGLYDERDKFIQPIQGKVDFQRRVLGLSARPPPFTNENETAATQFCPASDENMLMAGANQTMSLVQFYMATCPDCQGFSPYFKRFARDIGPHWHKLVRVYVVNCNDHQNIHLCQEENPRLIVPMVRWYVLPIIQADALAQRSRISSGPKTNELQSSLGETTTTNNGTCRRIKYPRALLNVAHRQFVDRQRRDVISLRHATLRFTLHMLDVLSGHNDTKEPPEASRDMFHALGIHWRHLPQVGHAAHHHFKDLKPANEFARELQWRVQECLRAANGEIVHPIGNRNGHHHHHHHGKRDASNDANHDVTSDHEHLTSGHEHHHEHTSGRHHHHEHHLDMTHHESHHMNMTDHHKHNTTSDDGGGVGGSLRYHNQDPRRLDKIENVTLKHFVVFEARNSFVGHTVIADWSSYVCNPDATRKVIKSTDTNSDPYRKTLMMVHRTSDMSVLATIFNQTKPTGDDEHVLVSFDLNPISARDLNGTEEIQSLRKRVVNFKILIKSSNEIKTRARRMAAAAAAAQPGRVRQRASLERYYRGGHYLQRRDTGANSSATYADKIQSQAEREHANWTPELVFPRVEESRYRMNKFIAREMRFNMLDGLSGDNPSGTDLVPLLPGALLAGKHPAEIATLRFNLFGAVDPKTDDLTLMFLTDYYKGLDEIMHTDLLSKGDLDGYQLLASSCFLNDLKRYFPFQGDAHGSEQVAGKSRARQYVQLVQQTWLGELEAHLSHGGRVNGSALTAYEEENIKQAFDTVRSLRRHGCPKLYELNDEPIKPLRGASKRRRASGSDVKIANEIGARLEQVRVPIRQLELDQAQIKKQHDVGLPPEKKFKWYYCAGSGAYLRGHTCSLWILFHTLTVNEYLDRVESGAWHSNGTAATTTNMPNVEYKFQIDFAQKPRRPCDPKNPDEAYLASKSSDHYVNETHHVLANIVNFVRYYLPCTNCAAHFSCMVNHSPGLSFDDSRLRSAPDSHLLWLWEGHNRVNERTRGTHSEDPRRPKHVFPVYEACAKCYIEKPASANASLVERKFNRHELVKFLVARYRKSAILNNKINIELLYKDT